MDYRPVFQFVPSSSELNLQPSPEARRLALVYCRPGSSEVTQVKLPEKLDSVLVGFGAHGQLTLRALYESSSGDIQSYLRWIRLQETSSGSRLHRLQAYVCGRDREASSATTAAAAAAAEPSDEELVAAAMEVDSERELIRGSVSVWLWMCTDCDSHPLVAGPSEPEDEEPGPSDEALSPGAQVEVTSSGVQAPLSLPPHPPPATSCHHLPPEPQVPTAADGVPAAIGAPAADHGVSAAHGVPAAGDGAPAAPAPPPAGSAGGRLREAPGSLVVPSPTQADLPSASRFPRAVLCMLAVPVDASQDLASAADLPPAFVHWDPDEGCTGPSGGSMYEEGRGLVTGHHEEAVPPPTAGLTHKLTCDLMHGCRERSRTSVCVSSSWPCAP
ncbi:uncharacterized protein V6R79_018538 [Siganus canaliculatus]